MAKSFRLHSLRRIVWSLTLSLGLSLIVPGLITTTTFVMAQIPAPRLGQWTWIGGSSRTREITRWPIGSVLGQESTTTTKYSPGARRSAVSFFDSTSNCYFLFGGLTADKAAFATDQFIPCTNLGLLYLMLTLPSRHMPPSHHSQPHHNHTIPDRNIS